MNFQHKLQDYILYAYFFLINYEAFDPLGTNGSFSVSKLFGIFYLLSVALNPSIFTKIHKGILKFIWPKIILILWISIVSLLNFNDVSTRFFELAVIMNLLIMISIISHSMRDNKLLDRCFFVYVLGSLSVSVLIFLNFGVTEDDSGRAQFFNSELNELAIKLTASLMIVIIYFFNDYLKLANKRFVLLMFVPLLLLAISRSGSRTALLLIILIIFFLIFLWIINSKYKILSFFFGSVFIATFVVGIVFSINAFQESSVAIERLALTGSELDNSRGARFFLWAGFTSIMLNYNDNIFFGNGLSGFDKLCYDFFGFIESPHNVLLEVLIYSGILGLILYIIFLYKTFFAAINLYKFDSNILGVVLIPVALTFIFALQGMSEKICWLIFAYIISKSIFLMQNKKA